MKTLRILSVLLIFSILLAAVPMTAFADPEPRGRGIQSTDSDAEALIGEDGYASLATAFVSAVDGDTVLLLSDCVVIMDIPVSNTVTLDLNGHRVVLADDACFSVGGVDGGDLTLTDTSGAPGSIVSSDGYCFSVGLYGYLTLSGGVTVVSGGDCAIRTATSGCTVVIDDAVIDTTWGGGYPFHVVRSSQNVADFTVNGGSFRSNSAIFAGYGSAVVNVYGGTFDAPVLLAGTDDQYDLVDDFTIYDGWFRTGMTGLNERITADRQTEEGSNGMTGFTHVMLCDFVARVGDRQFGTFESAAEACASSTGFTLIYLLADIEEPYYLAPGKSINVVPGDFSLTVLPSEEGYVVMDAVAPLSDDAYAVNYYTVFRPAYVHGIGYPTVADAFAAALDGETVSLSSNCVVDANVGVTKAVTLDLNGHNVVFENNAYFSVGGVDGGDLTVTDTSGSPGSIVSSDGYCFSVGLYGYLTLSGGVTVVSGGDCAIRTTTSGCTVVINDAVIDTTSGSGYPFYVVRSSQNLAEYYVYGGSFRSNTAIFAGYGSADINLCGGVFDAPVISRGTDDYYSFSAIFSISGGYFPEDLRSHTDYLSADHRIVNGTGDMSGYVTVEEIPYVAQVGGTKYEFIAPAAQAAVLSGEPVLLLRDLTDNCPLYAGQTLRINKNGHTVNVYLIEIDGRGNYFVEERTEGDTSVYTSSPAYEVGNSRYSSLTAAIAAVNAENPTVRLLDDVDGRCEPDYDPDLYVTEITVPDKTVTIDLNGHSMDYGFSVVLWDGGALTLTDRSVACDGCFRGLFNVYSGKLTIEGGVLDCGEYSSSLWIGDATVEITGDACIVMRSMWLDNGGELLVTGGCFSDDPSGLISDEYKALDPQSSGKEGFYRVVARHNVAEKNGVKYEDFTQAVEAEGQYVVLLDDIPESYVLTEGQTLSVVKQGFELTVVPYDSAFFVYMSVSPIIFDDGTYVLTEYSLRPAVAAIGKTSFDSLAAALASAVDGDTVLLLSNCVVVTEVGVTKAVTLDLNGHNVLLANGAYFSVGGVDGGDLTLTDTSGAPGSIVSSDGCCFSVGLYGYLTLSGGFTVVSGGDCAIRTTTSGCTVVINDAVIDTTWGGGYPFYVVRSSQNLAEYYVYDGSFLSTTAIFAGYGSADINLCGGVFDAPVLSQGTDDYYSFIDTIRISGGWFRTGMTGLSERITAECRTEEGLNGMTGFTHVMLRDFVARVGDRQFRTFESAAEACASSTGFTLIYLLADIEEPYYLAPGKSINVVPGDFSLTVLPSEEGYVVMDAVAPLSDDAYAVNYYTVFRPAYVHGIGYPTFAQAAAAANGDVITLYGNIDEAYTIEAGDTILVNKNGFALTVQPGSEEIDEEYQLSCSVEEGITTYTSTLYTTWVNGAYYMDFADAVTAAGTEYVICLLKDVDVPYKMLSPTQEFKVARNYHTLNFIHPDDSEDGQKWAVVTSAISDEQQDQPSDRSRIGTHSSPRRVGVYVHHSFSDQIWVRSAKALYALIRGAISTHHVSLDTALSYAETGDILSVLAPTGLGVPAGTTLTVSSGLDANEKFMLFAGVVVIAANIVEGIVTSVTSSGVPVDVYCHYNGGSGTDGFDMQGDWQGKLAVTEPTPPTKTGYKFGGWYYDSDFTDAFDTTANLTGELFSKYAVEEDKYGYRLAYKIEIWAKWDPYVAQVDDQYYDSFSAAVSAAGVTGASSAVKVIILHKDADAPYTLTFNDTLKVMTQGHALTVNPPSGFSVSSQTDGNGVTTYTVTGGVAMVGSTRYLTFQAAVLEASSRIITLIGNVPDAYTLSYGMSFKVKKGAYTLTVNPPSNNFLIEQTDENGVTTYSSFGGEARVGETHYRTFAEAVQAANGADVILLSDVSADYTLASDQTVSVLEGEYSLTVLPPSADHEIATVVTTDAQQVQRTTYTAVRLWNVTLKIKTEDREDVVCRVRGGDAFTPDALIWEDYVVYRWYTDRDCAIEYDLTLPVTGDLILYALPDLFGDINRDGFLSIPDVSELLNVLAGLEDLPLTLCDVNRDGTVDISDVSELLNMLSAL